MAAEPLLKEFPPITTAAWEEAIARDLKGADYEKRLIWRTEEGLRVKPYYRAEDLKGLACLDAAPGQFPFRRGARDRGNWGIREEIDAAEAEAANRAARAAVAAGADSIAFTRAVASRESDVGVLLAHLGEIPVHFAKADQTLLRCLAQRSAARPGDERISTGYDALADVEFAAEILRATAAGFVPFTIDARTLEEAGATAVEEIGFALAAGVDFLAAMDERGVAAQRAAAALEFSFAVGTHYFFEIAKLRALRMLWARVAERFGIKNGAAPARIAARTSRWSETLYDPQVNTLRGTTEAMAAILGGADWVTVAPFDECYAEPADASRRLARNTQLLLRHEAALGRVADAGGGSYYLEAITDDLAREGWKLMQQIEAYGGYRAEPAKGVLAQTLERSLAAREKAVASRRRVLIGTNQFANATERVLDRIDNDHIRATKRGAGAFERLRLRTERHTAGGGRTPRVLLAEAGDVKMRGARSHFAANFFTCAGFEIVTKRFKKAAEIAAAECDLIVLCSADADYAALVAELMPQLRAAERTTPVIVAGNPEDAEELKAAGVADFAHVRSNVVEVLTKWQERLGIKD